MKARFELICGPMYSGKTEELLRRLKRAQIAKKEIGLFKPDVDNRYSTTKVVSHQGAEMEAIPLDHIFDIFTYAEDLDVIGLDEVQFFDKHAIMSIQMLVKRGATVIASGLDTDYTFRGFNIMPELLALAEKVDKLSAICIKCGEDATRTQRLIDNKPARHDGPTVMVGGIESYEARCRNCYEIGL